MSLQLGEPQALARRDQSSEAPTATGWAVTGQTHSKVLPEIKTSRISRQTERGVAMETIS